MNIILMRYSNCFLFVLLFVASCGPSQEQKKKAIATRIGRETCNDISNLSIGLVGGLVNSLVKELSNGNISDINTGTLGQMPESWCNCYTYYVVKDLTEKFTYKELVEIKRDKAKQMMVLQKIVEVHGEDLKQCIADSTGAIFKSYTDFENDLQKKFNR